MNETYRKRGVTTRLEIRAGGAVIVQTSEHGESTIADGVFRARTLSSPSVGEGAGDSNAVESMGLSLEEMIPATVSLERATILEGSADHWWTEGDTERSWRENNARLHATLLNADRKTRISTNLGAAHLNQIDLTLLTPAIAALADMRSASIPASPMNLTLENAVTAELWAALLEAILRQPDSKYATLEMRQQLCPQSTRDGRGEEIRCVPLTNANGPLGIPNFFRPSYRVPPMRAAFHLDAVGIPTASAPSECSAVATLFPFANDGRRLSVTLLCSNPSGTFRGVVSMTPAEWAERLRAAGEDSFWFPVDAGSYGRRLMLEGVEIQGVS